MWAEGCFVCEIGWQTWPCKVITRCCRRYIQAPTPSRASLQTTSEQWLNTSGAVGPSICSSLARLKCLNNLVLWQDSHSNRHNHAIKERHKTKLLLRGCRVPADIQRAVKGWIRFQHLQTRTDQQVRYGVWVICKSNEYHISGCPRTCCRYFFKDKLLKAAVRTS